MACQDTENLSILVSAPETWLLVILLPPKVKQLAFPTDPAIVTFLPLMLSQCFLPPLHTMKQTWEKSRDVGACSVLSLGLRSCDKL